MSPQPGSPKFNEQNKATSIPTSNNDPLISLQAANAILTEKNEKLDNLVTEYTTKFKEFELQLTHKFHKAEEVYTNKIDRLNQQIKNQKVKLHAIQSENKSIKSENTYYRELLQETESTNIYKEQSKKFEFQIKEQNRALNRLHTANIKWRADGLYWEQQKQEYLQQIESLKKELSAKYNSMNNVLQNPQRTNSRKWGWMKSGKTTSTKQMKSSSTRTISSKHPNHHSGSEYSTKFVDTTHGLLPIQLFTSKSSEV